MKRIVWQVLGAVLKCCKTACECGAVDAHLGLDVLVVVLQEADQLLHAACSNKCAKEGCIVLVHQKEAGEGMCGQSKSGVRIHCCLLVTSRAQEAAVAGHVIGVWHEHDAPHLHKQIWASVLIPFSSSIIHLASCRHEQQQQCSACTIRELYGH